MAGKSSDCSVDLEDAAKTNQLTESMQSEYAAAAVRSKILQARSNCLRAKVPDARHGQVLRMVTLAEMWSRS